MEEAATEKHIQPVQPMTKSDEKLWATLSHLSGLVGAVIPFCNAIAPLIIWLMYKDKSAFVEKEAKKSLNFQISITIYIVVSSLLTFVVIGAPLLVAVVIFDVVCVIMAAIKTNNGEDYRYPLSLQLIK